MVFGCLLLVVRLLFCVCMVVGDGGLLVDDCALFGICLLVFVVLCDWGCIVVVVVLCD